MGDVDSVNQLFNAVMVYPNGGMSSVIKLHHGINIGDINDPVLGEAAWLLMKKGHMSCGLLVVFGNGKCVSHKYGDLDGHE